MFFVMLWLTFVYFGKYLHIPKVRNWRKLRRMEKSRDAWTSPETPMGVVSRKRHPVRNRWPRRDFRATADAIPAPGYSCHRAASAPELPTGSCRRVFGSARRGFPTAGQCASPSINGGEHVGG